MNAFRGLSRGIVPELESAWLFKIAHNVCLSRRRSSWRRGKVEAPNNFEVLQEIVPGRERVADELIRLQDVLEEMPENQRRAILLREWQGLTYREISAELGLSQAAVETLIFRARRAPATKPKPAATTHSARKITSSGPALIASQPNRIAPRAERPRSVERRLPRPAALPASSPEDTPSAPAPPASPDIAPAPPSPASESPPAAASTEPSVPPAEPAPQRRPQSTTQPDDPAPIAPAADPTPPPAADTPGQDKPDKPDKPDHPDHPSNGNGNGNGNGQGNDKK